MKLDVSILFILFCRDKSHNISKEHSRSLEHLKHAEKGFYTRGIFTGNQNIDPNVYNYQESFIHLTQIYLYKPDFESLHGKYRKDKRQITSCSPIIRTKTTRKCLEVRIFALCFIEVSFLRCCHEKRGALIML